MAKVYQLRLWGEPEEVKKTPTKKRGGNLEKKSILRSIKIKRKN